MFIVLSQRILACRLQQKAILIDQLINQFKNHIAFIKTHPGESITHNSEEAALRKENSILKQKIETLKNRLCSAETKSGLKQIPLPYNGQNHVLNHKENSPTNQSDKTPEPSIPGKQVKQTSTKSNQSADVKENKNDAPQKKVKAPAKSAPANASPEVIDVSRLDMRIGQIVQVEKHPDADSLYVEKVNIGNGNVITVVSGLVKHVPIDQMQDRKAVFMCNLKPAKMRGILSEGMIMCASTPDKVEILVPPADSQPGDRVTVDTYPGEPDAQLNPKKKIWEQVKPDLRVDANRLACYKGAQWNVAGKGHVKSSSLADVQIA